ncbi:MAG: DUF1707 SHOCT-like domain-containing protein [Propionicimonas sp.]
MSVEFGGVGQADREQVIGELRRAAEDGRLAPSELDERTERTRAARNFADLGALVADLGSPRAWAAGGLAARVPAGLVMAGYSPADPLELSAGRTASHRGGPWTVPPFLSIQASFDTVRINCLQARPAAELIDLEVHAGAATVVLILPGGWAVNTDRLSKGIGTIRVKVPELPAPGCPIFVVRGSVGIGTFKARGASRHELRRLARGR